MPQSSFPHTQSWIVQFSALPENLEELKLLPEAGLLQPYHTAALTVAALCAYVKNPAAATLMLDYLKGPQPMSTYDKQFLADRLRGKDYLPNSFFSGAVPERIPARAPAYTHNNGDRAQRRTAKRGLYAALYPVGRSRQSASGKAAAKAFHGAVVFVGADAAQRYPSAGIM